MNMRCYVCDASDWNKVMYNGKPIHSQATTQVCKSCGVACHEVDVSKEKEVLEFYRKEYRPAPNVNNLLTTARKRSYIQVFLHDFLLANRNRQMKVGDVGCATGYLPGFFKQLGHLATGCEYTLTYRRTAEHYYGIPTTEELETKHKYDLITIYHVLEHMMEPDKKLEHYASLLADGGHMLVATPEWFNQLEEGSGTPSESWEHLYHKNHINLFSRQAIRNLFHKVGLQVVKQDYEQYGQTYLLKKSSNSRPEDWLVRENWNEVEREMLRDYRALELFMAGKPKEALEVKKKFPEAWMSMIFGKAAKDPGRQQELMDEAEQYVGGNRRFLIAKGQWQYQRGDMKGAIDSFSKIVSLKPNEEIFMYLGYAHAQTGNMQEAIRCFQAACEIDPRKWVEAQTWILKLVSEAPMWEERAMAQAKEILFKGALEKGEIKPKLEVFPEQEPAKS